jgi:hypothetical protein
MRSRKFDIDKQTSFVKNHSVLGSKALLTDVDAIQKTENEFYNEYWYQNGQPMLRRFIEVKYTLTNYIKDQIKLKSEVNSQTKMFSNLTYELNQYRISQNLPLVEFYFVVQTDGKLPYHVFNVTGINKDLKFEYVGEVKDIENFKKVFKFD